MFNSKKKQQELFDRVHMIKPTSKAALKQQCLFLCNLKVEVTNITEIDGSTLDSLECGDVVIKVTGNQKHSYRVSYKGKGVGEGICLTYVDAGTVGTVAYDYTEEGWAYNSTDHTTLTPD